MRIQWHLPFEPSPKFKRLFSKRPTAKQRKDFEVFCKECERRGRPILPKQSERADTIHVPVKDRRQFRAVLGLIGLAADVKLPEEIEIDAFAEWARAAEFPDIPTTQTGWFELLGREKLPPDVFATGGKIRPRAITAYLSGKEQRQETTRAASAGKRYKVADLAGELGMSNATLHKHAVRAGVPTADRGMRNHTFNADERRRILIEISEHGGTKTHRDKARALLG